MLAKLNKILRIPEKIPCDLRLHMLIGVVLVSILSVFTINVFIVISALVLITSIALLSLGFPLACELGYRTSKIWNFKYMSGGWEHQEVWYGLIQDIVLLGLMVLTHIRIIYYMS